MSSTIERTSVSQSQPGMNWSRALLAGLAATVVMTIVMVAMGMNLMKSLGAMMVGQNASPGLQYAVGGTIHLMIGLIYGFIFAWLFGRVTEWNRFIKGAVYGLAIAAIAFAAMPLMSSMGGGGKSASSPCHTAKGGAMNPCHGKEAMNPCHPKEGRAAMNPCHPQQAAANPCGGGGGATSSLLSVINHLIYALTLAFVYKAR
jgi:hypothetical protein